MFCEDPTNWFAYFLAAFQGGSGYAVIVAMQGYAVKRVPKMIRGIVMALIIFGSGVGGIVYLQISKLFFKSAPNMVFGLIGLFDLAVLVFIVIMIALGKYGDIAPQEDTFGEGNSQKNEKTADFVKDQEYDNDIPDVPFGHDLYDEHIPEMSEQFENSSYHTRRFGGKKSKVHGEDMTEDLESEEQDFIGSIKIGTVRETGMGSKLHGTGSKVITKDQDYGNSLLHDDSDVMGSFPNLNKNNRSLVNKSDESENDGKLLRRSGDDTR